MEATEARGNEPVREVLASVDGLRVQAVTIAPGQRIPWHRHSEVSDTIVAVTGQVVVEFRDEAPQRLAPGDRITVAPGVEHSVHGAADGACQFINLHAGGVYDFVAS